MDAEGASEDLGGHGSHDEQKIPVYRLSVSQDIAKSLLNHIHIDSTQSE